MFWQELDRVNTELKNQPNGTKVTLYVKSGSLWLRGTLPVKPHLKSASRPKKYQQWLCLGQRATLDIEGLQYALSQAQVINGQLISGRFQWEDWQLNRTDNPESLLFVWEKFKASRTLSLNTIEGFYPQIERYFKLLDSKNFQNTQAVVNYLKASYTPLVACRVLQYLKASHTYSYQQGFIDTNNYADISLPKIFRHRNINPFSSQERDTIIQAFENHERFYYYASFVKVCFFTGARLSEVIALQWRHIGHSEILFNQTKTRISGIIEQGLKNQSKRYFPLNNQLKNILSALKANNATVTLDDFIFLLGSKCRKAGQPINYAQFYNKAWNPIVNNLASKGLILDYRNPYQMRHTFITMCLDKNVPVKDLARWVGNTPEVIYRHYAGFNKNLDVPEL